MSRWRLLPPMVLVSAVTLAVVGVACAGKAAPGSRAAARGTTPTTTASSLRQAEQTSLPAAGQLAATTSQARNLPDVINWVTLDVGSATYNQHQAVSRAVAAREQISIRLIPKGTDLGRLAIYRDGGADFGNDLNIYATEGVTFFAEKDAGPVANRLVALNWPKTNQLVGCAGDLGIREPRDLKGKRIVYVANSFGFNLNMEATLAAGNLTWNDVKRVDIPSYGGAGRFIMEGKADCVWTASNTGFVYEMASSPRGYAPVYMKTPEEDPGMWERFRRINPAASVNRATIGAPPISDQHPHIGNGPHFGTIATLAEKDPAYVYAVARAIYEAFPDYSGTYPGLEGFGPDRVRFDAIYSPVHEGAIRYFRDRGWWTDAAEQRNQNLLKREPVLRAAWEAALQDPHGKDLNGDSWERFWMKRRVEALKSAGLDPYWEDAFWLRLK